MKMKSIRLDFPAEGITVSNDEITNVLYNALFEYKAASKGPMGRLIAGRMQDAAEIALVDEYDSKHGGPVFYIP